MIACISLGSTEGVAAPRLHFVRSIGNPWPEGESHWMGFVAFKGDGSAVASDGVGTGGNEGAIWSFPEGTPLRLLPHNPWAISRDFKYYAWADGYGEVESGKTLLAFPDNEWAIFTFSSDSRYVIHTRPVNRSGEPTIQVTELATGAEVSRFETHHGFALAVSPDNRTVASGHWDIVALWDMFTGRRIAVLRGMNRYVESLGFSDDGRLLAAGSDLGTLQLWDVARRSRIWSVEIPGLDVSNPAFSPDGSLIAVGVYGTGTVWLIDAGSGAIIDHAKISDLGCGAVAFSPDGRFLITPSTGGLIKRPPDRGGTIRVFEVTPR